MKGLSFLLLMLLYQLSCRAQIVVTRPMINTFYTAEVDKGTRELRIGGDSISFISRIPGRPDIRRTYHIEAKEKRDGQQLLYVRRAFLTMGGTSGLKRPPAKQSLKSAEFGTIILRYSGDNQEMKVLVNSHWFSSSPKAREALVNISSFHENSFHPYYSGAVFRTMIQRPCVTSINKTTLQQIIDRWGERVSGAQQEFQVTKGGGLVYGPTPSQDLLTQVLIEDRLSPITSLAEMDSIGAGLAVSYPPLPSLHHSGGRLIVTDTTVIHQ